MVSYSIRFYSLDNLYHLKAEFFKEEVVSDDFLREKCVDPDSYATKLSYDYMKLHEREFFYTITQMYFDC